MRLFIAADGDSIGKLVGQARLNDNIEEIRRVSQAIDKGNKIFESFALANGGSVIESGGDEVLIDIEATALKDLESVRNQYFSATNATISVGIGKKPSEASKALLAAKFRGKDRSVFYDPDVEKDIKAAKDATGDEKDKIVKEYLLKSLPLIKRANDSGGRAQPEQAQNDVIAQNTAQIPAAPITQETVQAGVQEGAIPVQGQSMPPEAQQPIVSNDPAPQPNYKDFENKFRVHADQHESASKAAQIKQSSNYKDIKAKVAESLEKIKEQLPYISQLKDTNPEAYNAIIKLVQSIILMGKELDETDKKLSKAESFIKGLPSPTGFVPESPIQDTLGVSDDGFGKQEIAFGGKADGKTPEEFDPEQLAIGTQHELEHTKDVNVAQKIAMDHLVEDPDYYKKLQKSEDQRDLISRELQYDGSNYTKGLDQRHDFTHQQDGSKWLYIETTKQESFAAEAAYNLAAAIKDVDGPYHVLAYNMLGRHGIMERNVMGDNLTNIKPQTLTTQEKLDLVVEFLIDWLVGNSTTSGENLIRTPDGHIVSMAKQDAFKDFTGIGSYYQNYIDCAKNGSIMFDLNTLEPYFQIIDSISDDEYLDNIGQYAQSMWPEDTEAQTNFAKLMLLRKRNARILFTSLFKQELNKGERPEYGHMRAYINAPVGAVIYGKIKVRHWDGSESWKSIRKGAILGLDPGLVGEGHPVSAANPQAK